MASGTVNIAGTIDSSWQGAQKYTISKLDARTQGVGSTFSTNPPMTSSTVYLLWDDNNLYVAEDRVQTSAGLPVVDPHVDATMYFENSLGVFFACGNSTLTQAGYTINGHYTVWGIPTGPDKKAHIWLRAGNNGQESDTYPTWPIVGKLNSTGYTMTMAIPWSALQAVPWKVQKGARVAFTLLATAASPTSAAATTSPGPVWGQYMLVGNGDTPSTWGVLTLS